MSRQRLIVTIFLIAVSLGLLAHFLLIWIFGKYVVYENNKVILGLETFFVFGAFSVGLAEFLRLSTRVTQVKRKVLALEHVADSTDIRVVDQSDDFWKLNWRFALRNRCISSLRFDVLVKYFDVDGSIIHDDFVSNLSVAPECLSFFSDCTLVPSSIAASIAHARVEIMQCATLHKHNKKHLHKDSRLPHYRPLLGDVK
jgi:hypothetical protein